MPPTWPIRQSLGSGFGQPASTTKLGADVPAGAREAQRVSPRVATAPASRSAAAAALSAAAGVCGGPPQATMPILDTSAAAAARKRAGDMANPPHRIETSQCGPLVAHWLLRGCWLLNVSRTMNQAPPILR